MPFIGANFKIWQMRVTLWLPVINVFWVFKGKHEGELTPEKEKAYSEANTILQKLCKIRTSATKPLKRYGIPSTLNMEVQMLALSCTSLSSTTTIRW
jgi:hypothetical protein